MLGVTIELLGRCLKCVIGKRSTKYCRTQKSHTEPKAYPCLDCYLDGNTTSKCRQELRHLHSNGVKTIPLHSAPVHGYDSLPRSYQELDSLSVTVSTDTDVADMSTLKYATGFLTDYSAEKFDGWLDRFCKQTNTRFSVHTGKQDNSKSEHGTLCIKDKHETYSVKWSKCYNCFRGGKGRLKPEVKDPLKRRNAPGSRCCECPAAIRTRLLLLASSLQILEIQVPLSSAHQNHDPTSIPDQLCNKPLPEIESKIESLINDVRLSPVSLRMAIQDWVKKELIPLHLSNGTLEHPPQLFNRSYFPTNKDLRNIARHAIVKRRNSLFDQEALEVLLKEKTKSEGLKYFFQKYSSPAHEEGQEAMKTRYYC